MENEIENETNKENRNTETCFSNDMRPRVKPLKGKSISDLQHSPVRRAIIQSDNAGVPSNEMGPKGPVTRLPMDS